MVKKCDFKLKIAQVPELEGWWDHHWGSADHPYGPSRVNSVF
jgi:hypothetical protein